MRKTVQENIQDELSQPIADMEFVSVEPGKYGPRDEGGIRWKPNLNVDVVLKVRYTKPSSGTGLSLSEAKHKLGLQNGQYAEGTCKKRSFVARGCDRPEQIKAASEEVSLDAEAVPASEKRIRSGSWGIAGRFLRGYSSLQ
jgi:hypothetical protein